MDSDISSIMNHAILSGLQQIAIRAGVPADHIIDWANDKWIRNARDPFAGFSSEIVAGKSRKRNKTRSAMQPLRSVFSNLNGTTVKAFVPHGELVQRQYPVADAVLWTTDEYARRLNELKNFLEQCSNLKNPSEVAMNGLERLLEGIPAEPEIDDLGDYTLYDKIRLTAALSGCLYYYRGERAECADTEKNGAAEEKSFLLYSCDFSGIQNFIFQVVSDEAKKSIRSRSFYLEFFMLNHVDGILDSLGLGRANLLYAGGGHAFLILPNTAFTTKCLEKATEQANSWLTDQFGSLLYLAAAWIPCSAENLMNIPEKENPYAGLFRTLSRENGIKKMHRYSAAELIRINRKSPLPEDGRECIACGRQGRLNEKNKCPMCEAFAGFSKELLKSDRIFVVTDMKPLSAVSLSFPGGLWLSVAAEDSIKNGFQNNACRIYSENVMGTIPIRRTDFGADWFINDKEGSKTEEIKRTGILKMDVDNLGNAFLQGFRFQNADGSTGNSETLFRTSAFSRAVSTFFGTEIKAVLSAGTDGTGYRAEVVYSGGDDVFLIGDWSDIVDASIEIRNAFSQYSAHQLTLSAGIGIFAPKYPVYFSATETEALVESAKKFPGKNAVALFAEDCVFQWDVFAQKVLEEKMALLSKFFSECSSQGNSFLYRLYRLLHEQKENQVNLARYAYVLARMKPSRKDKSCEIYALFSQKMYQWAMNIEDRNELIAAIGIYFYKHRKE